MRVFRAIVVLEIPFLLVLRWKSFIRFVGGGKVSYSSTLENVSGSF